MAAPPLPGATYHTADFAFHSSPDVDLEAVGSSGPSEKDSSTLESRIHLPIQTSHDKARTRRGPPVLLILLLLCCLAFVISALTGRASDDARCCVPCEPGPHAPLVEQISAQFESAPHAERVYVTQERALDILKQKYNTSRVGCHAANVRDYMRRSYPAVVSSLEWTNVSQSAIVLGWQGADPKLKSVIITNEPEVLGSMLEPARAFQFENEDRTFKDLGDVQSAVGLLTAVDALVQSGYQPSRTLVFSVMLGEGTDLQKLSRYLHATYGKHGVDMGHRFPPPPSYKNGILDKIWHVLLGFYNRLYWRVSSLFPAKPHRIPADDARPRVLRYVDPDPGSRELPARAVGWWADIIVRAGR